MGGKTKLKRNLRRKRIARRAQGESLVIFVSYSPFDLRNDREHLLSLLRSLETELADVAKRDVKLFYARGISPGDDWGRIIAKYLDRADAFLAILTPQFLNSRYCLRETKRFLKLESQMSRSDLLIPIHYLGDKSRLLDSSLGGLLLQRQMLNWQMLRFESPDSSKVRRKIKQAAERITKVIQRPSLDDRRSSDAGGEVPA